MTIRNEVCNPWFDKNDCFITCNMSKYIKYERLKILFQKIIQPFPIKTLYTVLFIQAGLGLV